ncbi:MAG: 30S ribosomal protein S5 [Patescibacteria group bacterium]
MENEQEKNIVTAETPAPAPAEAPVAVPAPSAGQAERPGRSRRPGGRPGSRRPGGRPPRQKSEFDQKMINIRRVARVMAGGRRFSFSVAIIIGNKKGKVGVGLGKAGDTTLAIDKAVRDAKKHMITVSLTKNNSIAHDVSAKYAASCVTIMPAKGRGLVAGSSVRPVLELAGVTDVVGKIHSGSKNGLNNARAAIEALKNLKS